MGACNSVDDVECKNIRVESHEAMSLKDFQLWVEGGIQQGEDTNGRQSADFNESVKKARNFIRDCNDPSKQPGNDKVDRGSVNIFKNNIKNTSRCTVKHTIKNDDYSESYYYSDSDSADLLNHQYEYSDSSSHTSDYIYLNK